VPAYRNNSIWVKRRYKILLGTIALCVVIYFCDREYWDYVFVRFVANQMQLEAFDYGPFLPPVDKVDVMLLQGIQKSKENTGFMETRISDYDIGGQKTLTGKEAEDVAQIWRYIPQNPHYVALCHDPLYALRFWKDGKKICEVTICWHCSNFGLTVPGDLPLGDREFGFDSQSRAAIALLNKLKQIVPPPVPATEKK
jgi:hypothetical protein